jgi:hypothetical protein
MARWVRKTLRVDDRLEQVIRATVDRAKKKEQDILRQALEIGLKHIEDGPAL